MATPSRARDAMKPSGGGRYGGFGAVCRRRGGSRTGVANASMRFGGLGSMPSRASVQILVAR
jgi:hypothetical protein